MNVRPIRARRLRLVPVTLAVIAVLVFAATASAVDGSLPGGTSISVDITAPPGGTTLNGPNVPVSGTAAVGEGQPVPNTGLIYSIDGSGSTVAPAGGDCGPDQNPGDPEAAEDEIIDCEIAAVITLNDAVADLGTVGQVGMQLWAGAAVTADATPAAGDVALIAPDADAQPNGTPDVDEVLHSIRIAGLVGEDSGFSQFSVKPTPDIIGTDFADAAAAACALAATLSTPTKQVVFVSDGVANVGADVTTVLPCAGVVFNTFAVGAASSCSGDPFGLGSLQEIATLTGGTCTEVDDPTDLPEEIIPAIVQSQLTEIAVSLDQTQNGLPDSPFVALTNADIAPDLPQQGPASVNWNTVFGPLAPGDYEVCARATGSDGGGTGNVIECSTFHVNAPPDCSALETNLTRLWPPNHKLRLVTVTGASDPEGDDIVTAVTGVTQDEPVNGLGDGDKSPDAVLAPLSNQVRLRAERSGTGDGRVYRIAVTVTDEFGLTCSAILRVAVPHDLAHAAVDSAPPSFNSLLP
jgi:trimeric autotransporter adhesin